MVANDGVIFLWHFSKVSINDLFSLVYLEADVRRNERKMGGFAS
jgi:hypothetical protein